MQCIGWNKAIALYGDSERSDVKREEGEGEEERERDRKVWNNHMPNAQGLAFLV